MKDLSKKIVEAEFLPLDPYRATKEEVLSEDTFRYLNAIENEFFKESILLKVRDIAKNLGVKDEFNRLYKAYNKEYGKGNDQDAYKKYKKHPRLLAFCCPPNPPTKNPYSSLFP